MDSDQAVRASTMKKKRTQFQTMPQVFTFVLPMPSWFHIFIPDSQKSLEFGDDDVQSEAEHGRYEQKNT
jgi:hypothetical protein